MVADMLSFNLCHWYIAKVKNYNVNVTAVLDLDFKNAFPEIFNFTVGILILLPFSGHWSLKVIWENFWIIFFIRIPEVILPGITFSRAIFDFIIVEKEDLVEEDENPPNEPEPTAPKPTTTHTGSSLVIPEDAKSSSNVENSRNSMKVSSTENTNHRLR